ncbi:MAG TPA: oxygen-dependent coproporphyrinogen oxidase [Chryseosolibacter sp.]|nr:oxygen-dependent coproporphyrinogen oxidase [Chryseosolibacter sp.]
MDSITKEDIKQWLRKLQDDICRELEKADGKGTFKTDPWERPGGGGGITRVLTGGNIIEKGGVNFSAVWGQTPESMLKMLQIKDDIHPDFFATGVSIVLHPWSPMVPIIHMNVRYFEMSNGVWWFGGGIDLTPHYVNEDDARYFHSRLKAVCDAHDPAYYIDYKKWADDYFFIRHRNETRGIGGIFFDYLKTDGSHSKESRFAFVRGVGESFAPIYTHLMAKNAQVPFNEKQKEWQLLRRGRYVEFNLVWDRGTKFGLETDGRTESILMSLPPHAQWDYNMKPAANSPEAKTIALLRKGIDWIVPPR